MLSPEPVLYENAQDARASDTAMPAEPIRARGLRPTRSMNSIATTVPRILTIDVERLISREPDWSMPTDCHRIDAGRPADVPEAPTHASLLAGRTARSEEAAK
jgi:hypothetical protein